LLSAANFVDCVGGFLNVFIIRLRSLLLVASLSFESERVLFIMNNFYVSRISSNRKFSQNPQFNKVAATSLWAIDYPTFA
jgi:hypothetical protein